MKDPLSAKWPVTEKQVTPVAIHRRYLSPKEVAGLYDMKYSTFMKRLKNFVQHGEYPPAAFKVDRLLGTQTREYWQVGIHHRLGIKALNKHFYPRLVVQ
jgi:hypothetical protein